MGTKSLFYLIRASGNTSPTTGDSFLTDVTGAVAGAKMTDYVCNGLTDNVTTAITPAWFPPRPPTFTPIASGTSYNVVVTFTGGSRLSNIVFGYGAAAVARNPDVTTLSKVTLAYVSRSGTAFTYTITFTGNGGTVTGNAAGTITTSCDPCNPNCDLYRVTMTMVPTTTTGTQSDVYFGFLGKPDTGEFNDWQTSPSGGNDRYGITVNGTTPTLEYAWTDSALAPDAGGNVVATTAVFQTGLAQTWNLSRWGWVRVAGAGNTWYGTGRMRYTDPCP